MAIQEGNIKLLTSQVMDDVPEGGGRATGTAIVDGASNAIFPDISELDRAIGRVNLRKAFVAVDTPDTDGYFGANVIIAAPPSDAHVSCTLFTTHDGFDRRSDAQSRLESYVIAGPLSTMRLYGNQISGQRAVLAYQREEAPLPEVGEVLVLSSESGTIASQFVRITKVEHSVQTFTDVTGDFTRRVITLTTSDALRQDFTGAEPSRLANDPALLSTAKIRKTVVADASRYYGTRPLALAASVGDFTLKADTIYTPLVPSSTTETPVTLADVQAVTRVVASGAAITLPSSVWGGAGPKTLYPRGGITPGSVVLSIGVANDDWPKIDDSAGNIVLPSGTVVGSVDYALGILIPDSTQAAAWANVNASTVTYTPGTEVAQSSFTRRIAITLATRGSVYQEALVPLPTPGTTVVDYMALGKWYRLQDNGSGVMKGVEPSIGTGTVNYATGAVLVTLGALPDVDSAVLFNWGSPVDTRVRTNTAGGYTTRVKLAQNTAARNTVTVSYTKNGAFKTLTESGTGVLSGGGESGTINYLTGDIVINGTRDAGTDVTVAYSYGDVPAAPVLTSETFSSVAREPDATVNIGLASTSAIVPHTVSMAWNVRYQAINIDAPYSTIVRVKDDGAGTLKYPNGTTAGTIDYATGAIHFNPDTAVLFPSPQYSATGTGASTSYAYTGMSMMSLNFTANYDFTITVAYQNTDSIASLSTATEVFTPPLTFELVPGSSEKVLPNGLYFAIDTTPYIDKNGLLYKDVSVTTGSGTEAGTIDYATGIVTLTNWPAVSTLTVKSCLTVLNGRTAVGADFRTAGAPIRPASFYVQATGADGTLITGTANQSGVVTGAKVRGTVNSTTGAASVEFGAMVTAAGNERAWWYDAANVVGGQIWRPTEVFPGTIQYNTVVVATLPLDAGIIGLDPVRLPSDGRVPIFRAGNIAVVHHTTVRAPQTVANGQTVNMERTRLSRLKVTGNDGAVITSGYVADLDAGTILFTNIAGYSQPVTIEHRIEDMALVSDAQINGNLTITRPLTHDFPLGSFVSSALIIGDMRARVPILFDQATWNSTWMDSLVGSAATATFNDVLAPITVTNQGTITERWIVQFTNTTTFNVIGEHVGVITTGNTASDCAPVNPASGVPYFTLPAIGWGAGWAAGNVLRFNTIGALYPLWIARTIQQGAPTASSDSFTVLIRGDIDHP